MSQQDILVKKVIDDLTPLIVATQAEHRTEYIEVSVCLLVSAMRGAAGDDYVRGFLGAALADLDKPATVFVKPVH